VRRTFSSFPGGLQGAGLFLLRVSLAVAILNAQSAPAMVCAAVLLIGFWTPLGAVAAILVELWRYHAGIGSLQIHAETLLVALSLILLGPGAWSVDARRFGWKRIKV